jgi:hypothetical protein
MVLSTIAGGQVGGQGQALPEQELLRQALDLLRSVCCLFLFVLPKRLKIC